MEVTGNFSHWTDCFPDNYLPQLFKVILDEWPHFRKPSLKALENRITHNFVDHLNRKARNRIPFGFFYRDKQTSSTKDSEEGEIDIAVRAGFEPTVFFGIECKRLNIVGKDGSIRSDAGKYIDKGGMGCFLSGQYRGGGDSAGMIGYVMDAQIDSAKEAINAKLEKCAKKLTLMSPKTFVPATDIDPTNRVLQTKHSKPKKSFRIFHLLLPF